MKPIFVVPLAIALLSVLVLSGCVQQTPTANYAAPTPEETINEVLPEEPIAPLSCPDAGIQFDSCSVTDGIAYIGVYNYGLEDLNGFTLQVKYTDGSTETKLFPLQEIDSRDIQALQFPAPSKKIDSVIISADQCPALKANGSTCYQ
ncbi:MAG: hypothetical protein WC602_06800 [archaeon]